MARLRTMLFVAASLATVAGDGVPAGEERTPGEWIEALARDDASGRARAARALGRLDGPMEAILPALVAARRDADPEARAEAEAAWSRIGPGVRAVVPYLRQQLGGNAPGIDPGVTSPRPYPQDQAKAVMALGQCGLEAVPALLDALARPSDPSPSGGMTNAANPSGSHVALITRPLHVPYASSSRFRTLLVETLGKFGPPVVPTLVEAMEDRKASLREGAAEALGLVGGPAGEAAVSALARALDDRDALVRQKAIVSLGQVVDRASGVAPALIAALGHGDPAVRRGAVLALSRARPLPEGAAKALGGALADSDPVVRLKAAEALFEADSGSADALAGLLEALEDRDAGIRQMAVAALGRLGPRWSGLAAPALGDLTNHDDPAVRIVAAKALAMSGPEGRERALDTLSTLLSAPDADARLGAAEALSGLGRADEAIPFLLTSLGDREGNASVRAYQLLDRIVPGNAGEAAPPLIEALRQASPEGRTQVLSLLKRIGPSAREAAPSLARLLSDPDQDVRDLAISILEEIARPPDGALPAVIEALKAPDAPIRARLVPLLGRFPSGGAAPALAGLLKDPDPRVRDRAIQALPRMGDQGRAAALPVVREMLRGGDPQQQSRALAYLATPDFVGAGSVVPDLVDALDAPTPSPRSDEPGGGPDSASRPGRGATYPSGSSPHPPAAAPAALRREIIETLGRLGPEAAPALPTLSWIAADECDPARGEAAEAIRHIDPGAEAVPRGR